MRGGGGRGEWRGTKGEESSIFKQRRWQTSRERERKSEKEREREHTQKETHQHDSLVLREDLNQRVGEHAFHGVHCSVPLLLASVSVTAERNAELHVGVVGRNFGFWRGRSWRRGGIGIEGRREEEEEEEKG